MTFKMMCLKALTIISTLFFARSVSGQEYFPNVTYKDLLDLKAGCAEYHSCERPRYGDDLRYNCNCGDFCSQIDTCCVDSQYRDQYPTERKPYSCVKKGGYLPPHYYHMVDSCDPAWSGDYLTKKSCEGSAQELDNIFAAIPVTNNKTGFTYKNYFCGTCNNDTKDEELVFWDLALGYDSEEFNDLEYPDVHFNSTIGTWTYVNDTSGEISMVFAEFRIPHSIRNHVHRCFPRMISKCAEDWNDTVVDAKCKAYMASVFYFKPGNTMFYRNPHCALCNHEKLEDMMCTWELRGYEAEMCYNLFFMRIFSLYDKTNKCEDSMVYDTFAKKCRKV